MHRNLHRYDTDAGLIDHPFDEVGRKQSSASWPGVLLAALLIPIMGLVVIARSPQIERRKNDVAACITLEMVVAHGHLDDVGYRRIVRALTSDGNPYREEFPATYRAFMDACAALRATNDAKIAVEGHRLAERE